MKITIYTVTDCEFSKQEKEYLSSHTLQFDEKNLETNKEWLTEMLAVSNNFAGTPVTKIEKDDGQIVVLKGFTKEEFDQTLGFAEAPKPAMADAAPTPEPAVMPPTPPMAPVDAPLPPPLDPTPPPVEPPMPPAAPMTDSTMPNTEPPVMPPMPEAPAVPPTTEPAAPQVNTAQLDDLLNSLQAKANTPPPAAPQAPTPTPPPGSPSIPNPDFS